MDLKSATNFVRRRRLLGLLAGGVFFRNVHAATPACVEAPRQTEGPYFLDHRLERSDIRKDTDGTVSAGVPLHLKIGVRAADSGCEPMSNLIVDVWHCNAQGVYSGVRDPRFGRVGTHFLRGYQVTDENGEVRFDTIYPGWYPGRAVHIHVKLIWPRGSAQGSVREWSSQLYFDDDITDRIHARSPYAGQGRRRQRNEDDALFRHGGENLVLDLAPEGEGYVGRIDLGVNGQS